jgi:hypothetical protein
MFLSNRDIRWAIDCRLFIFDPRPESFRTGYDETSVDLHLDEVKEAKVWDIERFAREQADRGDKAGTPPGTVRLRTVQRAIPD